MLFHNYHETKRLYRIIIIICPIGHYTHARSRIVLTENNIIYNICGTYIIYMAYNIIQVTITIAVVGRTGQSVTISLSSIIMI